jgi:hypothetical protein
MTPVDVAGFNSVQLSDSNGTYFDFYTGATQQARIISLPNDLRINQITSGTLGLWTNNTERLRIDSAGLVGIGTSDPSTILTIQKNIDSSAYGSGTQVIDFKTPYPGFDVGTIKSSIYSGVSSQVPLATNKGYLAFLTHNGTSLTEKLRIESNGSVGIGATPSAGNKLHVAVDADGDYAIYGISPGSSGLTGLNPDGTNGNVLRWGGVGTNAGVLRFISGASSERARLTSSGQLLVGTSTGVAIGAGSEALIQGAVSTGFNLALYSTINSSGAGGIAIGKSRNGAVVQNNDDLGSIVFAGHDGTDYQTRSASIAAFVDGTPGANDMPGRLTFSTTADGAASPTERMRITNDGYIRFNITGDPGSSGNNGVQIGFASQNYWRSRNSGTGSYGHMVFYNDNGNVGNITTSGSATAYNTSSDYRLKENVAAVTDGITRLQQLKPSRFNFIADPDHTVDGFIAHEAQAVVPECVTGEKDAVDADGNPVYQGIDQSKLVPLLTAALQEAIAKIESLEARLTAAGIE